MNLLRVRRYEEGHDSDVGRVRSDHLPRFRRKDRRVLGGHCRYPERGGSSVPLETSRGHTDPPRGT